MSSSWPGAEALTCRWAGRHACQPAAAISLPQEPSVGIWYGAGWIVWISNAPSASAVNEPRRFHSGMFGANCE